MKTRLWVFFIVVSLVSSVFAAGPIGKIISLEGNATAVSQDGQIRALQIKSPVYLNDKIVTAEASKLQISFNDDSIISQGEKSEMVVDEYVFSPTKKDDNCCSIKILEGMFRTITGKITKINPERFRVRTKMATIGIRGCDVGFVVTEQSANVYVISLAGGESITVVARDKVGGGEWDGLLSGKWDDPTVAGQHLINVIKDHRIISITQGVGTPVQRSLTPSELSTLIESVTPVNASQPPQTTPGGTTPVGDTSGTVVPGGTTAPLPATPTGTEGAAPASGTTGGDTVAAPMIDPVEVGMGLNNVFQPSAESTPVTPAADSSVEQSGAEESNNQTQSSATPDGQTVAGVDSVVMTTGDGTTVALDPALANALVEALVDSGVTIPDGGTLVLTTDPNTGTVTIDPTTVNTTPSVDSSSGSSTSAEPVTPPGSVSTYTAMGGGADWSWGSWEVDGMLDHVSVKGNILPIDDFTKIAAGGVTHNLTGVGIAAAVLSDGSVKSLVQGTCNLYVTVGGGAFPNWNGSFSMANGSDNLSFVTYGDIDGTGTLKVDPLNNLTGFSMQVNGANFGSSHVNSWGLSGNLLGPAGATKPTGAMGTYNFNCFNGSRSGTANGIFGTDLN